jgi:uncharacterized protein (TIRG00374 family)
MLRSIVLSIVLSVIGIAVVVLWLGEPADISRLLELDGRTVMIGMLLMVASYLFGGIRVMLLAKLTGNNITMWRATRAHILGVFSACVTPSGSGNHLGLALALGRWGVPASTGWSIAIYTSVLDLLFYAWSVPLALIFLGVTHNPFGTRFLWFALPLGGLFLALWYLLAYKLHWLDPIAARLLSISSLKKWRRNGLRFLRRLGQVTARMNEGRLGVQLGLQLLTAGMHLAVLALFPIFAFSFGAVLPVLSTFALLLLIWVGAYIIPTPGASGFMEFAVSFLFSQQADASLVTPAVLTWRIFSYYASLLLGAVLGGVLMSRLIADTLNTAPTETTLPPQEPEQT